MVHIEDLTGDLTAARLKILESLAGNGVSLDFLKLTPSGLSFLVSIDQSERLDQVLKLAGCHYEVNKPRSIVLIYAVNIRDEEGMIAGIVQQLIQSGAKVDHLGDMHDRLLAVVRADDAERIADHFREVVAQHA